MSEKEGNIECFAERECENCEKVILDGERYFARVISVEYEQNDEIFTEGAIVEEILCLKCALKLNKLGDLKKTVMLEKKG